MVGITGPISVFMKTRRARSDVALPLIRSAKFSKCFIEFVYFEGRDFVFIYD
jgi:hypothetical protein